MYDSDIEKQILDAFEGVRASGKIMDELNEEEKVYAKNGIKEARDTKSLFINQWINTELKRYGRLKKYDLIRLVVWMRLKDLAEILKQNMEEKKL